MKKSELKKLIIESINELKTKFVPREGVEVKPYTAQGGGITRFFGVYEDGTLLTVCVYKRGAENVARRIIELKSASKNVIN
jgi:hypothetical protein